MRKRHCQKIAQLMLTLPESECEKTFASVSEHLSNCEACRKLHSGLQKMESVLVGGKLQAEEVARYGHAGKNRLLTETAIPQKEKRRGLRLAWAGAATILLAPVAVLIALLLRGGDRSARESDVLSAPRVTQAMMAEASSQTLGEFVEAVSRREAHSLEPSDNQSFFPRNLYFPRLLQECMLRSGDTLRAIAQSSKNILRRSEW